MHQIAELLHLAFRQEDAIYRIGRIAKAVCDGGFDHRSGNGIGIQGFYSSRCRRLCRLL